MGGSLVDLFWLQQANIVQEEEEEFPKYSLLYNTLLQVNRVNNKVNGRRGSSQNYFSLHQCYDTLGGGGGGGGGGERKGSSPLAYTNVITLLEGERERKGRSPLA